MDRGGLSDPFCVASVLEGPGGKPLWKLGCGPWHFWLLLNVVAWFGTGSVL